MPERVRLVDLAFDPAKHPRGPNGEFVKDPLDDLQDWEKALMVKDPEPQPLKHSLSHMEPLAAWESAPVGAVSKAKDPSDGKPLQKFENGQWGKDKGWLNSDEAQAQAKSWVGQKQDEHLKAMSANDTLAPSKTEWGKHLAGEFNEAPLGTVFLDNKSQVWQKVGENDWLHADPNGNSFSDIHATNFAMQGGGKFKEGVSDLPEKYKPKVHPSTQGAITAAESPYNGDPITFAFPPNGGPALSQTWTYDEDTATWTAPALNGVGAAPAPMPQAAFTDFVKNMASNPKNPQPYYGSKVPDDVLQTASATPTDVSTYQASHKAAPPDIPFDLHDMFYSDAKDPGDENYPVPTPENAKSKVAASSEDRPADIFQKVQNYTATWADTINPALRGGYAAGYSKAELERQADSFDKAFKPCKTDVTLFRTVPAAAFGKDSPWQVTADKKLIGKKFTEKSYVSTTMNKSWLNSAGIVMKIRVPKGTPVVNAANRESSGFSPTEQEIILGRGLKMQITQIRKLETPGGGIQTLVNVDVIGKGTKYKDADLNAAPVPPPPPPGPKQSIVPNKNEKFAAAKDALTKAPTGSLVTLKDGSGQYTKAVNGNWFEKDTTISIGISPGVLANYIDPINIQIPNTTKVALK